MFDFEENCLESSLFANRTKSSSRRRRNILALEVLWANELEIAEDYTVQANSTAEILQAFDTNKDGCNNESILL